MRGSEEEGGAGMWAAMRRRGGARAACARSTFGSARGAEATLLFPAFVATPMVLPWATIPAEEMIQTDDVVRIVRMLVELGPNCVVEELVVLRTGRVQL